MVSICRNEAYGIPHLLVAPKVQIGPQLPAELRHDDGNDQDENEADRTIYTNGVGDSRGYYDDGAYIALPEDEDADASNDDEKELHEAYFASILRRYNRLRKILHSTPPPDAAKRLSSSQATYAAPFGRNSGTNKTWANIMRNTDPHPLQLALMSKESVIRILRVLIGGTLLQRGHTLSERTSQWLWGLLARLPDRGELNHTEIGWIRDLGRRAVLLGRSLAEMAALRDELADGELGVNEGVDASSSDEEVHTDAEEDDPSANDTPEETLHNNAEEEENNNPSANANNSPNKGHDAAHDDEEDGEIQESDAADVAMDLDSSSDDEEDLETAKKKLLQRLQDADDAEDARMRLRMNMRATLDMVLTVAGDGYGQRDLLEFREPFVGM